MPLRATSANYSVAATYVPASLRIFKALCVVESLGSGFGASGYPTMLVEPHIIWRYATEEEREKLLPLKLAYPRPGTYPYGKYSEQPVKFHQIADVTHNTKLAILGTSFGLLQVLGANWQQCGSASPEDFYEEMSRSEGDQLILAARFMKSLGMAPHMTGVPHFADIATKWNGAGNVQRYAAKLESAWHSLPD